jgi:membrane protease YdiL (CAAX protease family)
MPARAPVRRDERQTGFGPRNGFMSDTAAAEDEQGRRRFHLALAGVFTLALLPIVSWGAALLQRKAASGPWRSRLFGLALFDTLVFACLVTVALWSSKPRAAPSHPTAAPSVMRPRIGVELKASPRLDGMTVVRVAAGSPAEGAGLLAGDEITAIDDDPVRDNERFRQIIAETPPGTPRTLRVRREGSEYDAPVTPAVPPAGHAGPPLPLFAPVPGQPSLFETSFLRTEALYLATLAVPALLAAAAWRRKVQARAAAYVMVTIVASALAVFVTLVAFEQTMGLSLGALLVGQLLGALTMLALAWFLMQKNARRPAAEPPLSPPASSPPRLGSWAVFGLGFFYTLAAVARASIGVAALSLTPRLPAHSASEVFGVSPSFGVAGVVLFGVSAVVVAPVAEECLFRGLLLPWLATWMRPTAAIFWSALAFGLGHLSYGSGVLVPLALGLSLGWMRLRSGKLRAGVVLHLVWNGIVLANLWLTTFR